MAAPRLLQQGSGRSSGIHSGYHRYRLVERLQKTPNRSLLTCPLGEPQDLKDLMAGLATAREIGNSAPLRPFMGREVTPGPLAAAELARDSGNCIDESGNSFFAMAWHLLASVAP